MDDELAAAIEGALAADPDNAALWLSLGRHRLATGDHAKAVAAAAEVLRLKPADADARELIAAAVSSSGPAGQSTPSTPSFDWAAAEGDVALAASALPAPLASGLRVEASGITFADVGGMQAVKDRLNAAFLAPLRNPALREAYGKSLRGGLLMYGPPGCGKTYLARALAGEVGAGFLTISLAEILDQYLGASEKNVRETFELARAVAPVVLFLDEIDAIGLRRSSAGPSIRGVVNQLLTELDGVNSTNEGVFVLAATNQPWEVDSALRRPGRLDRTVLVLPPDLPAREAIFRHSLERRPVDAIDIATLASRTEGFSGADIEYACEVAAERALMESVRTGEIRSLTTADLMDAIAEVQPSTRSWMNSARNVVLYGEDDGTFGELRSYLKKMKAW